MKKRNLFSLSRPTDSTHRESATDTTRKSRSHLYNCYRCAAARPSVPSHRSSGHPPTLLADLKLSSTEPVRPILTAANNGPSEAESLKQKQLKQRKFRSRLVSQSSCAVLRRLNLKEAPRTYSTVVFLQSTDIDTRLALKKRPILPLTNIFKNIAPI